MPGWVSSPLGANRKFHVGLRQGSLIQMHYERGVIKQWNKDWRTQDGRNSGRHLRKVNELGNNTARSKQRRVGISKRGDHHTGTTGKCSPEVYISAVRAPGARLDQLRCAATDTFHVTSGKRDRSEDYCRPTRSRLGRSPFNVRSNVCRSKTSCSRGTLVGLQVAVAKE